MAIEDRKSFLYKEPSRVKTVPVEPLNLNLPSNGQRAQGLSREVFTNRFSFYRPNFSTNSGISGGLTVSQTVGSQASPSQTLPIELVPTSYFAGDYFVPGYYE